MAVFKLLLFFVVFGMFATCLMICAGGSNRGNVKTIEPTPSPTAQPERIAAPVGEAPYLQQLAAYARREHLPKPEERDGDMVFYGLRERGLSNVSGFVLLRSHKGAWSANLEASDPDDFVPGRLGQMRILCPETGNRGFSFPLYLIESGPLKGVMVQVQRSPEQPNGYQAILASKDYVHYDRDLPPQWRQCAPWNFN